MINLSSFNDLVPKSGRYAKDVTYIKVTDSMCQMVLGKGDYEQVVKYLGNTVNAKVSRDLGIIVLMKGADRRINSTSRSVSLVSLKEQLKEKYGDAINCIYLDCRWDEDETGRKVYVAQVNGRKEYQADATIHKLRG